MKRRFLALVLPFLLALVLACASADMTAAEACAADPSCYPAPAGSR